ncbi:Rho-type GTPase activating protein Rga1 [Tilletia horrida]|uniref:Rho-type GTPase activating protein Rga1 n=1 Tax=Tilletia horrida TaxID=155126 RepID=A0AAN6JUW6_9BASI|nr:Rho-type GTPase activating protein Rga1 [Tilletia horrida]
MTSAQPSPISTTAPTLGHPVASSSQHKQDAAHAHSNPTPSTSKRDQRCAHCQEPMTGQFVRALGAVYHLDCFRCHDCGKIVAAKFFPATDDMVDSTTTTPVEGKINNNGSNNSPTTGSGKLFPLCETDYFKRLDLLCAKCGCALRGSYITALGMKFHVEHFTCSVCPTVFGPHDSYYEHNSRVYCHFHYSTRFAIKCTGCRTAILKQFVEINRNNVDEHWHPECYMIHKFWNIKICPTGSTPKEGSSHSDHTPAQLTVSASTGANDNDDTLAAAHVTADFNADSAGITGTNRPEPQLSAEAIEAEQTETPTSLRQKQRQMEQQVYRIWTVLSAFEESSAACISEMLRHVSHGRYLEGVRMAEKFILHVEILFSAIDDLEVEFRKEQAKGISHIREARMLCKKIVNFFSLLSHTQETGARRMDITQELLSLVTGLAHYLKILIRIALSGALRLDRDFNNRQAINWFLSQLAFLAREGTLSGDEKALNGSGSGAEATNASVTEVARRNGKETSGAGEGAGSSRISEDGRWYGYKSLPRAATRSSSSSVEPGESATDLCVTCGQTVEEDCFRFGIPRRWHATCLRCSSCQRPALPADSSSAASAGTKKGLGSAAAGSQDPPANAVDAPDPVSVDKFFLDIVRGGASNATGGNGGAGESAVAINGASPSTSKAVSNIVFCHTCAAGKGRPGFEPVTRLEQYAFLLRVALNRLFALLKKRGVVPPSPPAVASAGAQGFPQAVADGKGQGQPNQHQQMQHEQQAQLAGAANIVPPGGAAGPNEVSFPPPASDVPIHEAYRDSADFKRMKTVNLDRKVSTKARVPHISTVMASPSGRQTQTASPTSLLPPGGLPTGGQQPHPSVGAGQSALIEGQRLTRSPQQQQGTPPQGTWPTSPIEKEQPRIPRRSYSPGGRQPLPGATLPPMQPSLPPGGGSALSRPPINASSTLSAQQQSVAAAHATEPGSIVPIRPAFARHNTDVRIRNDGPLRDPSGDDGAKPPLGESSAEDGITLADIPHILEAEQARGQQHMHYHPAPAPLHQGYSGSGPSGAGGQGSNQHTRHAQQHPHSLPLHHPHHHPQSLLHPQYHHLHHRYQGRYISDLSALELFIIKHMAVMVLQQSALKDLIALDDLLEFIETRKNTFWGKIFKGGDKKKEVKKKGVFGIPLEILVERNGADSTLGASASHLRVPSFVDDIISAMKQMDVSVEGIFRKNGNIRRLKELSEALDRDSSAVNLLDDNPVQLAALLKKWLRELPDPLLTFKLHKLFVASQKLEPESERLRILHMVTMLLPKGHRDTMEVLFVFLKWVASFSHVDEETGSKMDLQNLALVLGPNILYSKGADPTKDETFLANSAIMQLLDHQDDFWTIPEDLEGILQDRELLNPSADLTSRDILKKCEKYATRRRATNGAGAGGGQGGMVGSGSAGGSGIRINPAQLAPHTTAATGGLHVETVTSRHQPHMHPANVPTSRAIYHMPPHQSGAYSQPPSAVEDVNGNGSLPRTTAVPVPPLRESSQGAQQQPSAPPPASASNNANHAGVPATPVMTQHAASQVSKSANVTPTTPSQQQPPSAS